MPRLCEPCRQHYPDDALTACPECGGKVKFTLLPPPGVAAAPLAGVPTGRTGRLGDNPEADDAFDFDSSAISRTVRPKNVSLYTFVGAVAAVALAACSVLAANADFEKRAEKVTPGMSIARAARVMGRDPDELPHPDDGAVVWTGGTKAVSIFYHNGCVSSVEPGRACSLRVRAANGGRCPLQEESP